MGLIYRTIAGSACKEIVIKRSQFIAFVEPIASETEVPMHLERIRKMHPNATHHCYAYNLKLPQHLQKSSDDGEPAGTAGRPILEAIHHHQLHHVLVVVVRYFGGVMLGAGGLIRAYGASALEGIRAAGIVERRKHQELEICMDYTDYGKVNFVLKQEHIPMGETVFEEGVRLICWPEIDSTGKIIEKITDATQNRAKIGKTNEKILDHRLSTSHNDNVIENDF